MIYNFIPLIVPGIIVIGLYVFFGIKFYRNRSNIREEEERCETETSLADIIDDCCVYDCSHARARRS